MMGPLSGKRVDSARLDILLAAGLCCILLGMAWLQFRWIGQVSQAEHDRLEANLNSSTDRLARDFNNELERMLGVLVGPEIPPPPVENVQVFESRVSAWRQTSRYAGLVKKVYLGDTANLPDDLRRLSERLRDDEGPPVGAPPPPVLVDAKVPALALPLPGHGGILIELDRSFIAQSMLPDLVDRDLGSEYLVRIADAQEPHAVIYQSTQKADAGEQGTGRQVSMLNLHLGPPNGRAGLPFRPPGWDPQRADAKQPRFDGKGKSKQKGKAGPPIIGPWILAVQFTSGPLEATVDHIRVRNLAVSFGMLLLVGLSGTMLVLSTRRARKLARQQVEFVAGVTHELRTPLTVISSASQNLADGVTTSGEQVKRYGTVIRDQSTRLTAMVEQVLRFAGMSTGRYEMQWQSVEIGSVIEQAIEACEPEFQRAGTWVHREIDPGLAKVEGDPSALGQCVRNLLANAAIHGTPNSTGRNAAQGQVKIRAAQTGGAIEIQVEDNGPGIDSGSLPHLFEPFFRGRRAIDDQIHGTGLGLSLVKNIMDAHGGTVEVRSRISEGTCFTLKLPLRTV